MPAEKSEPLLPPERDPDGKGILRDPDLNPMTNPTLARNLGKWAQVYFTTPPEQRDRAISKLLSDLETSAGAHSVDRAASGNTPAKDDRDTQATDSTRDGTSDLVCLRCHRRNTPQQWFCGYCGSSLRGNDLKSGRAELHVASPRDESRTLTSSSAHGPSSRMSDAQQTDLEWLRERSLSSFRTDHHSSHSFRTLLICALLMGLGGFVYFRWSNTNDVLPAPKHALSTATAALPQAATKVELSSSAVTPVSNNPPARSFSEQEHPAKKYEAPQAITAPSESPASAQGEEKDSEVRTAAPIAGDSGDRELAIAQTFLERGAKPRNASEAAKWLWISVSKHNTAALVLLADLYERGDGVIKSCDQAEVLLTAGSKRGCVEAAQKLRNLQSSGCK